MFPMLHKEPLPETVTTATPTQITKEEKRRIWILVFETKRYRIISFTRWVNGSPFLVLKFFGNRNYHSSYRICFIFPINQPEIISVRSKGELFGNFF